MTDAVNANYDISKSSFRFNQWQNNDSVSLPSIWSFTPNTDFLGAEPEYDPMNLMQRMMMQYLFMTTMSAPFASFSMNLSDFNKGNFNTAKNFDREFSTKSNLPALQNVYKPELSEKLAKIAYRNAKELEKTRTKPMCAMGVRTSLEKMGIANGFGVSSAKDADTQFRNKYKNSFQEVHVQPDDLKKLPAGCVIVWEAYNGKDGKYHKDGHIAVTLGNGDEASDFVGKIGLKGSKFSVFVPTSINKKDKPF